jgi:PAS domain S-box-containing protein
MILSSDDNHKKIKLLKGFLTTRYFLALIGICLVAISILLWKTQESRNLSLLESNTASAARSYSSEAETRFQSIYNAMDRMAKREALREQITLTEWGKDALFFLDTFQGIKSISWVDKSFLIKGIFPLSGNTSLLNKKANDLTMIPSEINVWIPITDGTTLKGFLLGIIDINAFFLPVIDDIKSNHMLKVSKDGKTILTSGNWIEPQEGFMVERIITFQNAGVLTLSIAPTPDLFKTETENSQKTLLISLSFSFIALIAIFFAQKYSAISKISEFRFRKTLEGMMEGCQIIAPDWRYLFVNDTATVQFQHSKAEMLGHTLMECFPGMENTELFQHLKRCMDDHIPQDMDHYFTLADGTQAWYQLSIVPAPDGIFMLSMDVTQRKQAEEALRKNQILLNETQRITRVGGWEYDPSTNKVTWTDEVYRIHGVSDNYDPSSPEQDMRFYTPEDQIKVSTAFQRACEIGQPYDLELQFNDAQGHQLWVRTIGQVEYHNGKITRVFGNIMDITERKLAEQQVLSQVNELQRWQDIMLGREDRVQELKREVNELCRRVGETVRYPSQDASQVYSEEDYL